MKLTPEEVYDLIDRCVKLFDIAYAYEIIPDLARRSGWRESSIRLVLEADLWTSTDEEMELYELSEHDSSDLAVSSDDEIDKEDVWRMDNREDGDPRPLNFNDHRKW